MSNSNLFKWKRSTPLHPVPEKKSGIKDWIKRVQAASDEAAAEAYGGIIPGIGDANSVLPDDQALYEAQELLDKWVQDQHVSNINMELEFKDENWASSTKPILNSQKDYQLDDIDSYSLTDAGTIVRHEPYRPVTDSSLYDDTDVDYDKEVKEMFSKFMSNSSLQSSVLDDLGMDKTTKKFKDPRPKMEQRHKMVKERNEARKNKLQTIRREQMMKKDAEAIARKRVLEEEKAREKKAQSEEAAIQKEMARIRKEMEEERTRLNDERIRKKDVIREAKEQMNIKSKAEERLRKEEEERRIKAEDEMRKQILIKMENKSIQDAAKNLRILHKHFSAWYGLIVDQRVKIGKARAIFDWRCKLRAWNAWKAYVTLIKSSKEAQEIATSLKIRYRKEQMALNHFRLKCLRKCFIGWQMWISEQQRLKSAEQEHQKKAFKMASFLEAAATGKLWDNEKENSERIVEVKGKSQSSKANSTLKNNEECVEEIFLSEENSRIPMSGNKVRNCSLSVKFPDKRNNNAWENSRENNKDRTRNERDTEEEKLKKCNCGRTNESDKGRSQDHRDRPMNHRNRPQSYSDRPNNLRNDLSVVKKDKQTPKRVAESRDKDEVTIKHDLSREKLPSKSRLLSDELKIDLESAVDVEQGTKESDFEETGRSEQKEIISRKPAVKSTKPVTKPVFLAMEERAKQREERKAIMEEKRKRQEEEKLERLKLEQEKLLLAELQLKNERIQQKKEEKRMQKERELEKKKRQEELQAACNKADNHYQTTLLKRLGLEPWKRLVQMGKLNHQIAEKYHRRSLLRTCISAWGKYTKEIKEHKIIMCDDVYNRMLLRRCFTAWTGYGKHFDFLENKARRHFSVTILQKYFVTWQHFVTNERLIYWSNEEKAEEHNERRLLKSALNSWKLFIVELKEERKKEKRKNELRKRVREWLPDFGAES